MGIKWWAIKINIIRLQYTDSGKLAIQGKTEDREDFACELKEYTERENKRRRTE